MGGELGRLEPADWITRRATGSLGHVFETELRDQIDQYLRPMNRFLKEDRGIEGECEQTFLSPTQSDRVDAAIVVETPEDIGQETAIFSRSGNKELVVTVGDVLLRYGHIWSGKEYVFRLTGTSKNSLKEQIGSFFDLDELVRDAMERLFFGD